MRVDFNNFAGEAPESSQSGRAAQAKTARSATANRHPPDAGSEKSLIQTSLGQTQIPTLTTQVLAQPEVREAKVQSLQESIENGEYSVVPSQVADAMVAEFGGVSG